MCNQAVLAPIYAAREKNTIGIYSSDIARGAGRGIVRRL